MAKNMYIGVNDTARKVKKWYIGVDGVARKVTKAYIGVNDVARLFYSGGSPVEPLLIDFYYKVNSDQTCTLTGWKGTLNGVRSTELVIPDDPLIIL